MGGIEVVISEELKLEFIEYLRSEYGEDAAYHADLFLKSLPNMKVVEQKRVKSHISMFKDRINEKDLPHLIVAEISKVESIISYDRDFKRAKTRIPVLTPKEFIEKLGIEPFESKY